MSDSNGNFYFVSGSGAPSSSNTSYYTCVPGTLLYAVASGGQSTYAGSAGGPNPSIKLMVALGPCGSIPLHFRVNELTTIAAVYELNAFRTIGGAGGDPLGDMTQLHGNSPAINNAFATDLVAVLLRDNPPQRSRLPKVAWGARRYSTALGWDD